MYTMHESVYNAFKRAFDVVFASLLIVLFLPFWIIIPILVKLDSDGPVIYRHKRLGKDKKPFYILKFRTMVDGAHEMLHGKESELLSKFKEGDWKLENDPRITKLGKILRSLTIDEFPQLFNILLGDMSLVGPRAYMAQEIHEQVKKYPQVKKLMKEVYAVKPGATGPWQVSGRNEIPFNQRVRLDAMYARKKSIWYDLLIVLKTPKAMFSKW